jgi:low affinity Fe/Cu permease
MNNVYRRIEAGFEKVTYAATLILGSSIGFILALVMMIFWMSSRAFYTQDIHHIILNCIHGATFLSLFIIQKEFNRFSAALHLKINELVASNKTARNAVIDAETKTEHEIIELSKAYTELAEIAKEKEAEKANNV